MDKIRLVTLDMVGTVIRFRQPPVAHYQRVAASHGHELDLKPLAASFKHQWVSMNKMYPHFGSTTEGMSSIVWWHQLVKVNMPDGKCLPTVFNLVLEYFQRCNGRSV